MYAQFEGVNLDGSDKISWGKPSKNRFFEILNLIISERRLNFEKVGEKAPR